MSLLLQLQVFVLLLLLLVGDIMCLLCPLMIDFMFGMQLYETLTVFLLKILWNLCCRGKCFAMRLRKNLPIFVERFMLYGGLNQMMLRFRFRFVLFVLFVGVYVKSWLYPERFKASV